MVDGPGPASSPIGPVIPLGEFVDCAVAAVEMSASPGGFFSSTKMVQYESLYQLTDKVPDVDQYLTC